MSEYSIRMPDMSRNMALAGKTVSTRGMNVTYNEKGYAISATNYGHSMFAATSKSICAPSKEAVLAGDTRTGYDGPDEDRTHFNDRQFARAVELRRQVAAGEISESEANRQLEEIRQLYGYTFGASGNVYAEIVLPDEQPEEVAKAAQKAAEAQSVSASAVSGQNAAAPEETHFQADYQAQLRVQQQHQTLQSELEELRMQSLRGFDEKDKTADALLDMMEREEDDQ